MLFVVVPNKDSITIKPHPDEVDEAKWVSKQELECMMKDPNLLFSPWFRIIAKKWLLSSWWNDLEQTMTTDKYCDFVTIHQFDPPSEHLGGVGKAGPLFLEGDTM